MMRLGWVWVRQEGHSGFISVHFMMHSQQNTCPQGVADLLAIGLEHISHSCSSPS